MAVTKIKESVKEVQEQTPQAPKAQFDPATGTAVFQQGLDEFQNRSSQVAGTINSLFEQFAGKSIKTLQEYLKFLNDAKEQGQSLDDVFKQMAENGIDIVRNLEPIQDKLQRAREKGKSFEEALNDATKEAKKLNIDTAEFEKILKAAEITAQKLDGALGESAKAMTSLGFATVNFVKELASAEPSWQKILGFALDAVVAIDKMTKISAESYRTSYDISAAMGDIGGKAEWSTKFIEKIRDDFNLSGTEATKIVKTVSELGGSIEEIKNVSSDVAARFKIWSELTPEKQMKMMSDYAGNFGVSLTQANSMLGETMGWAQKMHNAFKNISVDHLREQVHSIGISMSGWGYSLADSRGILESVAKTMEGIGGSLDLERAKEITQTFMTTGLGSAATMAYMVQQFGPSKLKEASIQEQIGATVLHGKVGGVTAKELSEMQAGYFQQITGIAAGEGKTKAEWAGGLVVAQEQGMIGKMSFAAIDKVSAMLERGDTEQAFKALHSAQRDFQESGLNTANNTKDLKKTAMEIAKHTSGMFEKMSITTDILTRQFFNLGPREGSSGAITTLQKAIRPGKVLSEEEFTKVSDALETLGESSEGKQAIEMLTKGIKKSGIKVMKDGKPTTMVLTADVQFNVAAEQIMDNPLYPARSSYVAGVKRR